MHHLGWNRTTAIFVVNLFFISFVTDLSSNDFCKNASRSTISAQDVLNALEELEFHDIRKEVSGKK